MKHTGEFNEIRISNPDGFIKGRADNGLRIFGNEGPRFVNENSMAKQIEVGKTPESIEVSNVTSQPVVSNSSSLSNAFTADNLSSLTSAASNAASGGASAAASAASTAASTATTAASGAAAGASAAAGAAAGAVSVTATVGGTVGAVAGVVASSVATAVLVVAVFISTLTINLSLVLADINSLIIQIEMNGAQEEDFNTHIVAILDGTDGKHIEQDVLPDSLYLKFTGLTPNTEYTVRVKNDEKVFVEKTFITAKESEEKGSISAYVENNVVYITVKDVRLKSDEFYSVYAKDEAGKILFGADSAEPNANFSFVLSTPQNLHFSISVGGVVYAVDHIEMTIEPEYDYTNPTWTWANDFSAATVTFAEKHGGDALVVPATVTSSTVAATCEEKQQNTYTATATIDGQAYNDSQTISVGEPLGHDYTGVEPTWEWTDTGEVDDEGIPVYTAVAVFACKNDPTHTMRMEGGDYSYEGGALCDEDSPAILYSRVTYNEVEYEGTKEITVPATGHAYGEAQWTWNEIGDGGWTAVLQFVCANNSEHIVQPEVTVTTSTTPATCEDAGTITYTATAMYGDTEYSDQKTVEGEPAHGHDYSDEPTWEWTDTGTVDAEGFPVYTAVATFTCKNDSTHTVDVNCEEINHEGNLASCEYEGMATFYASLDYNGNNYQDEYQVTLDPTGHDYITVFHWMPSGDGYQVEAYRICMKEDSSIPIEDVEVTPSTGDGYTLYTATATYEGVEYTEQKKVENDHTTLGVGAIYYVGDTIDIGSETTHFADDYEGAYRFNTHGTIEVSSILAAGDDGGASTAFTYEDILNYDRIVLYDPDYQYARMDDNSGGYHGSSMDETSIRFNPVSGKVLIGVTIVSGDGSADNPYVLSPLYQGATVTYDANGGIFNTSEGDVVKKYYTDEEVSGGVYAIPPTENPEADGRLFLGWFTDEYHENKFDFDTTPITENITLYAGWIALS